MNIPCSECHGAGCPTCGGTGEIDAFAAWGFTEAHAIAQLQLLIDMDTKLDDIKDVCDAILTQVS